MAKQFPQRQIYIGAENFDEVAEIIKKKMTAHDVGLRPYVKVVLRGPILEPDYREFAEPPERILSVLGDVDYMIVDQLKKSSKEFSDAIETLGETFPKRVLDIGGSIGSTHIFHAGLKKNAVNFLICSSIYTARQFTENASTGVITYAIIIYRTDGDVDVLNEEFDYFDSENKAPSLELFSPDLREILSDHMEALKRKTDNMSRRAPLSSPPSASPGFGSLSDSEEGSPPPPARRGFVEEEERLPNFHYARGFVPLVDRLTELGALAKDLKVPLVIWLDIDGTIFRENTQEVISHYPGDDVRVLLRYLEGKNYGFGTARQKSQAAETKAALKALGFVTNVYRDGLETKAELSVAAPSLEVLVDNKLNENLAPFVYENEPMYCYGIKIGSEPEALSSNPGPGDVQAKHCSAELLEFLNAAPASQPRAGLASESGDFNDEVTYFWRQTFEEALTLARSKDFDPIYVDSVVLFIEKVKMSPVTLNIKVMNFPGTPIGMLDYARDSGFKVVSSEEWSGKKAVLITHRLSGHSIKMELPIIKVGTGAEPNDPLFRELEDFMDSQLKAFLIGQMAEATSEASSAASSGKASAPAAASAADSVPAAAASKKQMSTSCNECADLEIQLKNCKKKLAQAEAFERTQAMMIYDQFVLNQVPFVDEKGKEHQINSLLDFVKAPGKLYGRRDLAVFIRKDTVRQLEESGDITLQE